LGWWKHGYASGYGIGNAFTYGAGVCRGLYERDEYIEDFSKYNEDTTINFDDLSAKEFDTEDGLLKKLDPGDDPDVKKVNSYFNHYGV
jgi:hypothetical protein